MIYIPITYDEVLVKIPKILDVPEEGEWQFRMYNTVNRSFEVDQIFNNGDFNEDFNCDFAIGLDDVIVSEGGNYFSFVMTFNPKMAVGSYEYFLVKGGRLLSVGMAQFGEFNNESDQYKKEVRYEQYQAD